MKTKQLLSILMIIGIITTVPLFTQAQSVGKPDGGLAP